MYPLDDTIAAIASAPGGAARGIVRSSGPRTLECSRTVFQSDDNRELQEPSRARVISGSLCLTGINAPVPCDLFIWPAGRSYTGQPVAEFHIPGSPPLLDALLKSLCMAGARMAERGEFTLRAFLSGRIDLTQAEAVLGVIDASDSRALRAAIVQLAGGLAGPLHRLRELLLELLAHLEAGFDFADEDLPFITPEQLERDLDEAMENIARLQAQMESRGAAQTAVRAVLMGRPNTGKSSLFNALTRDGQALVSDMPGTTRDYLAAELDFDGRKCQLVDTAGFHAESADFQFLLPSPVSGEGAGVRADGFHPPELGDCPNFRVNENGTVPFWPVELAAQKAAVQQIFQAHIRLLCLDAARPIDAWEQAELARNDDSNLIVVWTKIDAVQPEGISSINNLSGRPAVMTSSVAGIGLDLLRAELRRMVLALETPGGSDVVAGTAARCHESIRHAGECLRKASEICRYKGTVPFSLREKWDSPLIMGEDLIAAEIRTALDELGKVVGAVYTDDVLDRIFSRFCVGK
jgi:tRNA modification GTPase